jgi:hypothetical protein
MLVEESRAEEPESHWDRRAFFSTFPHRGFKLFIKARGSFVYVLFINKERSIGYKTMHLWGRGP